MNKNLLYVVITLIAAIIVTLLATGRPNQDTSQDVSPAALPTNGLTETPDAAAPQASDPVTEPSADAPAAATPNATGSPESDDVPAGAEVQDAPQTETTPAESNTLDVPPSEGQ
jgi:hypothetical protein